MVFSILFPVPTLTTSLLGKTKKLKNLSPYRTTLSTTREHENMGTANTIDLNQIQYRRGLKMIDAGLSIIPVRADGSKAPAASLLHGSTWKPFTESIVAPEELRRWCNQASFEIGFGIVGGKVSGNLEVLDIDDDTLTKPFRKLLQASMPGLYERLIRVRTPRPAQHLYYRTMGEATNGKKARKEYFQDGRRRFKTLIETKGEGGYVLAPGNPSSCHPTGRKYRLYGGCSLSNLPTLTVEEHSVVVQTASSFDEVPKVEKSVSVVSGMKTKATGTKPWDQFNREADWKDVLGKHDWRIVKQDANGRVYWRHPSANGSHSAVTGAFSEESADRLWVFSESTAFETATTIGDNNFRHSYSKFDALKILQFDGDFNAALNHIRLLGYEGGINLPFIQKAPPRRGRRK